MAIVQAGAAIGGTLIKGINALVDAKRVKSFNNALKMVAANVELLDILKGRIEDKNHRLTSQYRMMQMAHHRYNLLF